MSSALHPPLTKDDPISIIGAGVFGLSTAIHLAERGYHRVAVFDKQPYDQSEYSYFKGADAASADINKIVRSAYGGESIYQNLALEAIEEFKKWNDAIASGKLVPPGMTRDDRVFINNGELNMTDGGELLDFEKATIASMDTAGYPDSQLVTNDARHRGIARAKGMEFALDPFRREARGLPNVAVLDTTGGTACADKACRFALHKARGLGVGFIFGAEAGTLESLVYNSGSPRRVTGHKTKDGQLYSATMTILACGGWTPSLLPDLDGMCETTAGSVAMIKIPQDSYLWTRLAPENFPTWAYNMRSGAAGGLYGFARDGDGWLKIGYRGTKYTNPVRQPDGKERSVPVTRWSHPEAERLTSIPQQGLKVIERFMDEYLPELRAQGLGITMTRACWYNDSFDNHLVIDRVPDRGGLMVATGGSGHAFKYLPVIGKYIADVVEQIDLDRPALEAWRWRHSKEGTVPANALMEGSTGTRALKNVPLAMDQAQGLLSSKL